MTSGRSSVVDDIVEGPGPCILCDELVTWEEAGFYPTGNPLHSECGTRSALGGIGHLTDHWKWCVMAGDPDAGLSYRESALQVMEWLREHGAAAAVRVES